MPLTQEPKPRPTDLIYIPENSEPYRVKDGDSFFSLALLPQVQAAGLSAGDLCYFNFKTRKPIEINWYLKNKLGCTKITRDGKNYVFGGSDYPGIVYLPKLGVSLPINEYPPAPADEAELSSVWVGVGIKGGSMLGIAGIETLGGYVVNTGSPLKGFAITASTTRLGGGGGVSGGLAVIFVSGVTRASQLNGLLSGGLDYNLSLGENWGSIFKAKKLEPLMRVFSSLGVTGVNALKRVLGTPEGVTNFQKAVKSGLEAMDPNTTGEPTVVVMDFPLYGKGVEVSLFHAVSEFHAVEANLG
jgi:hypothetical protein